MILIIVSCKNEEGLILKKELQGNTFDIINLSYNIPSDFEFRDSTCTLYQMRNIDFPYSINHENNATIIVVGDDVGNLYRSIDDSYDYLIIGKEFKDSLKLKRRKQKWNEEEIYGEWIEKNDKENTSDSLSHYSIDENGIILLNKSKTRSKIRLNNTLELMNFNLKHSQSRTEIYWRIKSLNENEMKIERSFSDDSLITTQTNIKLIKKR